jgi:hypothetical protein
MSGSKEAYVKKYGAYAEAVLKAKGRASGLGHDHPGYQQAVADLERVKEEALEAMKTGGARQGSVLASFIGEVTDVLMKAGYQVKIDAKTSLMTVSK